jgi:hypothetical protein
MAISALVLAGLPTTSTLTSRSAWASSALPCTVKMAPLASSRSLRSMPGPRGRDPDQQRVLHPVEGDVRVVGRDDAVQEREGAVVELHDDALERLQRGRDLQEPQDHGLVASQEVAGGDAEEEGVADLTGGAGHRDVHGCVHGVASEGPPGRGMAAWRRPS